MFSARSVGRQLNSCGHWGVGLRIGSGNNAILWWDGSESLPYDKKILANASHNAA